MDEIIEGIKTATQPMIDIFLNGGFKLIILIATITIIIIFIIASVIKIKNKIKDKIRKNSRI